MKREIINPWTWQEALGFVHGNKVSDAESTFFLAGQTACDANGATLFPGDMEKMMAAHDHISENLKQRGCQHTGCLLGVTGLASPGALIEMEVTAVK